jgi:hypothetical protein
MTAPEIAAIQSEPAAVMVRSLGLLASWDCACGQKNNSVDIDFCPSCWADRETGDRTWAKLHEMDFRSGGAPRRSQPIDLHLHLTPLQCALIAVSASRYRFRHQYKEAGQRRGVLVRRNRRIKDLSASGIAKDAARKWIKIARARGWRGSVRAAVMSDANDQEHLQREGKS